MGHQVTRQAKTMMTRKITIIALIAGIVLGAAATEGFNVYRRSQDSQIFQQRVHCKAVADAYVKENSTDFKKDPNPSVGVTVTLDKADYSPARNSCVAEFERIDDFGRTGRESISVQDLLSGESLFSENCTDGCKAQSVWTDRAFDYVMKNASEPIELIKSYAHYASEIQSKSAFPSAVTQWDAQGNPIPSKSPPKSAPPSGR